MTKLSVAELNEQMKRAVTRLDELRTKDGTDDGLTDDEDREVDQLIGEVNDLGENLTRAKNLDKISADHKVSQQSRGRVSGIVPQGERAVVEEEDPREQRSLPSQFFDSDEMKSLRERQGKGVASMEFRSFWNMEQAQRPGATEQMN